MEGMTITFDGEAYESFQAVVANMEGYGVDITLNGEMFDAVLVGPDYAAEDGATVRFIRVLDDEYEISRYPATAIESAVVDLIEVS